MMLVPCLGSLERQVLDAIFEFGVAYVVELQIEGLDELGLGLAEELRE